MQKYTDVVTSARSGAAIPNARVTVKTSPGAVTATIYSDDGVTTQDNPLTTDSNGEFTFYAADGEYTLTVSGIGLTERTVGPIILHDPADSDDYAQAADVSFTPSGSGAISTTVQNRIRAGRPILLDFIPTARHSEIAAGTCTTDLTTYINAALTEMTALNCGTIEAPRGVLPWEGTIAVPTLVNIWGMGNGNTDSKGTEFKAQNAAATMTFGGLTSANGQRGGKSGHFRINANSLATQPFYVGRSVHRMFEQISIDDSAQDGFTLEEGQNNIFMGVNVAGSSRHDFMIDKGAGGNAFFRCQSDAPGEYSVYIQESTGIGPYGAQGPSHNGFYQSIFERSVAGKALYHGGGLDNSFHDCVFAANTHTSAASLLFMEIAGSATSSGRLRLIDPQFFGSQTYSTAVELAESGVSLLILGRIKLSALLYAFSLATGSELDFEDYDAANVTNMFTGTGSQNTIARKRFEVPLQVTRTATGDTALISRVDGDAGARFQITASGILQWRDGSDFSYDINLYRASGSVLATDDDFQANRLFSKQGTSSTALPAVTIASRNTTAVGNVGSGEDDLMSYTMVANAFSVATKGVKIKAWGTGANNANAKTLKIYFGSTAIYTASLTTSQANTWRFEAIVMSTAGAGVDAQDYWVEFKQWGTTAQDDADNGSTTADEESTIAIKCTGEATSDNDIVQEGMIVEFLN
jgi:hypothetical protein